MFLPNVFLLQASPSHNSRPSFLTPPHVQSCQSLLQIIFRIPPLSHWAAAKTINAVMQIRKRARVQWLIPVIPALGRLRWDRSWGQEFIKTSLANMVNPISSKNAKLAKCGGCLKSQLLKRMRQENRLHLRGRGCCELRLCYCTPTWATEQDSISKKTTTKKKKKHF